MTETNYLTLETLNDYIGKILLIIFPDFTLLEVMNLILTVWENLTGRTTAAENIALKEWNNRFYWPLFFVLWTLRLFSFSYLIAFLINFFLIENSTVKKSFFSICLRTLLCRFCRKERWTLERKKVSNQTKPSLASTIVHMTFIAVLLKKMMDDVISF